MIAPIHELSQRQFAESLGNVASHSKPIDELSHLKGREKQVEEVKEAIYAKGRHIFIYGERGVGKTSLAKTVGRTSATDSSMFKQIGCSTESTFPELLRQIVEVFDQRKLAEIEKKSGFGFAKLLSVTAERTETYAAPNITVSTAADILAS
jgi:Cdc6-like AAA superfamily ATPase